MSSHMGNICVSTESCVQSQQEKGRGFGAEGTTEAKLQSRKLSSVTRR